MILTGKIFVVTGGAGFFGNHIVKHLESRDAEVWIPRSEWNDFTRYEDAHSYFQRLRPEYVIHCAGYNGGIEFNRQFPADILYQNSVMAMNVHKAAEATGVKKLLSICI